MEIAVNNVHFDEYTTEELEEVVVEYIELTRDYYYNTLH